MRPRKIILYVSASEQDQSVMKFMLDTNRYKPLVASDSEQAVKIFSEMAVDMVMVDFLMGLESGNDIVAELKTCGSHIPMILLGDLFKMVGSTHAADAFLDKRTPRWELLDRIKVMTARKRGPRKGYTRTPALSA